MIRMILRQIWNERRANALVFLELLVVSVCLFYTADYLYIKYKEYKRPLGFDIGHVYNVELGVVPEGSPDFDTTAVHTSGAVADFLTIIERLSTDPRVESVCYTHNHFHYRYWNQFASFHGIDMQRVGFVRFVDPNYFRVFKVRSFNSQSSESLERAIRENQIVVTGTVAEAYEDEPLALRGQEIWITDQGGGDSVAYRVGAVCEPQRYQEFSPFDYAYYKHLDLSDAELNQAGLDLPRYLFLFIRVKPAADGATFVQDFKKDMEQRLRLGNIYLKEVKPMSYYREEILRTAFDNIRRGVIPLVQRVARHYRYLLVPHAATDAGDWFADGDWRVEAFDLLPDPVGGLYPVDARFRASGVDLREYELFGCPGRDFDADLTVRTFRVESVVRLREE